MVNIPVPISTCLLYRWPVYFYNTAFTACNVALRMVYLQVVHIPTSLQLSASDSTIMSGQSAPYQLLIKINTTAPTAIKGASLIWSCGVEGGVREPLPPPAVLTGEQVQQAASPSGLALTAPVYLFAGNYSVKVVLEDYVEFQAWELFPSRCESIKEVLMITVRAEQSRAEP